MSAGKRGRGNPMKTEQTLGPCLMLVGIIALSLYWLGCFVVGVGVGAFIDWLKNALML